MNIDPVLKQDLTPDQYAAAVDPAPEVLCLACAGSGKSTTLAYRIVRLLAQQALPENIVAFTFTEKAAESIKRRVSAALSAAGLDPTVMGAMYIGTIHAYCQRIMGDMNAIYRQFDVLDENRLKLFLISRYPDLNLHTFRRARGIGYFDTIRQAADAWNTANDELLDFARIAVEDPAVSELLQNIKTRLEADQYIDFSAMVRVATETLQSQSSGQQGITAPKHLMVDEYQDVNPCQETLIRVLHRRSESLFVVGDDDQSIYAWRGADVSNILDFKKRYPHCRVHTLSDNFRSTDPIVDASSHFAATQLGPTRHPKCPRAFADRSPQDLSVLWFSDRPDEAEWVAQRIDDLLGTEYYDNGTVRGLTPADFAVLMRSTRQPEQDGAPRHAAFTAALDNLNIPFSLEAGGGPFDCPQTAVLRSTFELLRNTLLNRNDLQRHFDDNVLPAYPKADFTLLSQALAAWSRQIHRPQGSSRVRLYPQQLVYELLHSFNIVNTHFDDNTMRDIGLFSRMIMDVETVYMSVDSNRFSEMLNFLQRAADTGYDVSTDDVLQRPDAVTVSTVHKMKGLEFPCVFLVDTESQRFPKRKSNYSGWLPPGAMAAALRRGAYQSTTDEEVRLFYTACTRAERYLYVTGAASLPSGRRTAKPSPFSLLLMGHPNVGKDANTLPIGLTPAVPRRRVLDTDYPTSFSEIRYYLQCPRSYQFRERYGLNPVVPEMFGYGRTVHTSLQKLHEAHPNFPPAPGTVEPTVTATFHLKHVPPSRDPVNRPGAYERGKARAVEIANEYVDNFGTDFERQRQVEAVFEIPAANCVISGSIDLLLEEDSQGNIVDAAIVDFKTLEGGDSPGANPDLDWTELALQVQLYARAADQVLGHNAKTGSVHLLKDNQRVEVPITPDAIDAAILNVEWAVNGILRSDFPMRPHPQKCDKCDFKLICSRSPESFDGSQQRPPELHVPGGIEMVRAFSRYRAH